MIGFDDELFQYWEGRDKFMVYSIKVNRINKAVKHTNFTHRAPSGLRRQWLLEDRASLLTSGDKSVLHGLRRLKVAPWSTHGMCGVFDG